LKGQQCSWRDMRKIKHILARKEKLEGEHEALMKCSARTTRLAWEKAIEVMNACPISDKSILQPSHAVEIARLAPSEEWQQWVERCEKAELTVVKLRSELMGKASKRATKHAETNVPTGHYSTIVVDPPWSYQNNSGRQKQGAENSGSVLISELANWHFLLSHFLCIPSRPFLNLYCCF